VEGWTQDNADTNRGYYTYDPDPAKPVRIIVLDSAFRPDGYEGQGMGSSYVDPVIDLAQYAWLQTELERALADKKLVIVSNHHPSHYLQDDNIPERFITTEEFVSELQLYPNVLIHCVGHSHENTDWPHPIDGGTGGYHEIQASSLIDWPQQIRFYEIVDNGNGTLSVFTVVVDHQGEPDSLSEYSRMLSLIDVQTGWGEGGRGVSMERNIEMVFAIPPGFTEIIEGAPSDDVRALGQWEQQAE